MIMLRYTHSVTNYDYMTLKFVCGVLYVRLGLLDPFFFEPVNSHRQTLHSLNRAS